MSCPQIAAPLPSTAMVQTVSVFTFHIFVTEKTIVQTARTRRTVVRLFPDGEDGENCGKTVRTARTRRTVVRLCPDGEDGAVVRRCRLINVADQSRIINCS